MVRYAHTQVGYLMLACTLGVLALFTWAQITARAEPPSYNSGTNFAITVVMVLTLFVLASFSTLTVVIDERCLRVRFGWGIFRKKVPLTEIATIRKVKNRWYYGWGIRCCFRPKMWIYNVSGFDAVELILRDGTIYRIGTDEPNALETALRAFAC